MAAHHEDLSEGLCDENPFAAGTHPATRPSTRDAAVLAARKENTTDEAHCQGAAASSVIRSRGFNRSFTRSMSVSTVIVALNAQLLRRVRP